MSTSPPKSVCRCGRKLSQHQTTACALPAHPPAANPSTPGGERRQPPLASPPSSAATPASAARSSPDATCPSSSSRQQQQQQQEARSPQYLARLLRLATTTTTTTPPPPPPGGSSSAMADFLSSFNLGSELPARSNDPGCASVDDLQLRLRAVLAAKTTPTRAEHVSLALELRASVRFALGTADPDGDALEGLSLVDPSLGGFRSHVVPAGENGGQAHRIVSATETLMNQPENDPVLQKAVAKHVIGAISAADGSSWTVREVSKGNQGWTFTYICKDSYQHWSRLNSKAFSHAIIGEYSLKEQDPVLSSRPAFDCRGSVVISFSRKSRSIMVKYDHTPLHKTVAELSEYFKPPPRQLGPGAQQLQKTPKKKSSEKTPRKRDRANTGAENPKPPRKRKKKNNGEKPSQPNLPYPDGTQAPVGNGQFGQGFNDYPPGLVENGSPTAPLQGNNANVQASNGTSLSLNLTPVEVARRREVAMAMLREADVDPDTLSVEQLNIFSNQSPDLQKDSLNMLVKYGAERLRIIHPSNRESGTPAAQSSSATSARSVEASPSGLRTTKELVLQDKTSRKKKAGGERKSGVDGGLQDTEQTPGESSRPLGKSRLACYQCKGRKVKCPRGRPACTECQTQGITCKYPLAKPRKKKSDAIVIDEDGEGESDDGLLDNSHVHEQGHANGENEHQDYSSHSHMPVADLLTSNLDDHADTDMHAPQPTYFQSASGLALPRSDLAHMPEQGMATPPGLVLPQGQGYSTGSADRGASMDAPQPQTSPEVSSPRQSKRKSKGSSSSSSRRSLPGKAARSPHGGVGAQDDPSANARAKSRQGQRAQTRTPGVDKAASSGYQAPKPAGQFGYEAGSQQQSGASTSSYAAYDSSHRAASGMSMPEQSTGSMAAGSSEYPASMANQWMGSQSRDATSHSGTSNYPSLDTFNHSGSQDQPHTSVQNFNVRQSMPSSRTGDSSLDHQNQQARHPTYSPYASQGQGQQSAQSAQPSSQQSNWYGFGDSSGTSDQRYNYRMQNQGWSGFN